MLASHSASHLAVRHACACRGHGDTLLLRLNVTAQSGGTLEATLSVQQQGFFPYRLDNFSSETLHVRWVHHAARLCSLCFACSKQTSDCCSALPANTDLGWSACSQQGCEEQEDILRPYSCLDYAWDEPSLPHQLVLALPGNLQLGSYPLDKVIPALRASGLPWSCSVPGLLSLGLLRPDSTVSDRLDCLGRSAQALWSLCLPTLA